MNIRLKNEFMRSIYSYEQARSKWPTLGRKRKLNIAQILDAFYTFAERVANGANFQSKERLTKLFTTILPSAEQFASIIT